MTSPISAAVKEILEDEGYRRHHRRIGRGGPRGTARQRPDVVLLDIWMPDLDGISLLREWNERGGLPCPVIMMSGHGTIETAVEATRLGAYDFVEKPISLAKLLLTVERALEASRLRRENEGLRNAVLRRRSIRSSPVGHPGTEGTNGKTHRARCLDSGPRRARHRQGIAGALAARKECASRRPVHHRAPGSIAREHAARALFGSEQNGTIQYGLIEQANGGTLFLDEVADLDPELQSAPVQWLERRPLIRCGAPDAVPIDLRVIAARPQDLEAIVQAGTFREELYYQLNVVPLQVPRLRERIEDIPELLRYYADFFANRDKLPYRNFPVAVQNRLRNYPWPGNLRELRNLVQRLLILGNAPEVSHRRSRTRPRHRSGGDRPLWRGALGIDFTLPLREARDEFERTYLLHQLGEAGGSVGKLAKTVGMERTHLYRKLKDLGVDPRASSREHG